MVMYLLQRTIVHFYKKLYQEDVAARPFLERISYNSIGEEDASELVKEFSEEEVWKAINDLGKDKAPGPDGFNIDFFQHCWNVVKKDISDLFAEFHKYGSFEKSLNATFITLLPKVAGAEDIYKFRPISLVGSVYKILAKVLASRLRLVIGKIVGPYQHAFVAGCQILDAALVANECVDACLKSNLPSLICKLDIEKAYDRVSWGFLMTILERMGFPAKWRKWVYFCISTVHFSILINGEATGFFPSTRGLRQGDPLSPLLFILLMETLSRLITKASDVGSLEGVLISGSHSNDTRVIHLLFADDTLIFCKPDISQLGYLRCILVLFEAM